MKAVVSDLIAEQSVVDSLVSAMTEEQWNQVIDNEIINVGDIPRIWTVKDEILHIALFDESAAKLMMGLGNDLFDIIPEETQDKYYRITPYRNWSKDEVLSWWRESRTKMNDLFYNIDPKARVPWAPGMPMSARSLASARLMETWAHSVDIYDQLRIPVRVEDRISHTLFLAYQARPNAYHINGLEMPDTPLYVECVLPSGKIWSKGPADAANYIKGSAAEWALVSIRRRNWMDTDLEVVGDDARQFASIVQTFAGESDEAPIPKRIR